MNRALCALALVAAACGSTVPPSAVGEFHGPGGMGATGAGDRDLVFIANSGQDSLRALQLCNSALLADGGVNPADTCSSNQNHQFIPAPIRVFPATIETGTRTLRVAGARLTRSADNTAAGVAIAVGADNTAAIVDARSLVDAQQTQGAIPKDVLHTDDLGARTVDVVAVNPIDPELDIEVPAPAGQTVPVFVATDAEVVALDVGLGSDGSAQKPPIGKRCTLAPVVPMKIAIVPGSAALVYVADGAGDGVVAVDTSSMSAAGGACTMHRISAGGRSVQSVAVSPRWYETVNGATVTHGPGDLLMIVLEPLAAASAGADLDPGGVLFLSTGTEAPEGVFPIPPFPLTDTTSERMQPISSSGSGIFQEGTFLRSVKPRATPISPDVQQCSVAPCTPLYVGVPSTDPLQSFSLLAVATSTSGATYFLEVLKRRFVNQTLYSLANDAALPPIVTTPVFTAPAPNAPTITINPSPIEPGVAHDSSWRAVWHSPIPGLTARGGVLATPAVPDGTLTFTTGGLDFTAWQNDPAIALAVGDVVSFGAFYLTDVAPQCQQVTASETTPFRFELPIVSIQPGSLTLAELADSPAGIGFHPDGCPSLGAVAEVRTAGSRPWLVSDGATVRGRVDPSGNFTARQRRFDYPRSSYDGTTTPPQASVLNPQNVAFTFTIVGNAPIARAAFQWGVSSSDTPVSYNDALAVGGLATAVYAYSSPRSQSLVFTSITGGNEVLQADPFLLSSNLSGLVAYR